jgi:hypothetical protein
VHRVEDKLLYCHPENVSPTRLDLLSGAEIPWCIVKGQQATQAYLEDLVKPVPQDAKEMRSLDMGAMSPGIKAEIPASCEGLT